MFRGFLPHRAAPSREDRILSEQHWSRIETHFGALPERTREVAVGFGLTGARIAFADGAQVMVKAASGGRGATLGLEGRMLQDLGKEPGFPVPHVHLCDDDLLVMDWIATDGSSITPAVERHAAEVLARLHEPTRAHFGYPYDTLIGPLPQPNPRCERWIAFFRDARLLPMAQAALHEGQLPPELMSGVERLSERLDAELIEPAHPSLIHGDLWTGNVLVADGRIAGLIDPAVSWSHPEIELAFTTMFGTFGRAFFQAYEALRPLEPGFHERRKAIYNLYPTLVHVRLFGGSYVGSLASTLSMLGVR